ncbi:peptidoglycan DD-metalloendopeptidase family protein [Idiomarina sp. HP20-50]|uniref:peptidoglycan DD-metalloendopeptidase family protein n=1 Tax=Idiomarina sp. HP20-50 TaxID=3070813 RepID=UPI00294B4F34|nr:peptidoglycan DD-metalloendopeptidase family protein [Idiomarina sp. HP20-50]MDV6315277.1 peptidoglycan DD-metalloendopeptidase family protein [Idiomarina sp. HP20-50]
MLVSPDAVKHLLFPLVAVLLLQACSGRTSPAPVDELYTGKTYRDFEPNSLTEKEYEVQPGETLYSIAFRANMDVQDIARINNLREPYTIYPGQKLSLVSLPQQGATSTRKSKPAASSKDNKEASNNAQNNIKTPVANTEQKEYGQKRSTRKTVAKQTDNRRRSQSKQRIERPEVEQFSNEEIAWRWPSSGQILAGFSLREQGNKGIDFAGNRGDSVNAAAAGKVVYVGSALQGFGNLIILKHNDDFITAYAHNESILVKEQEWVDVGETIARMGDSGSSRVKLHFEVRFRGKSVNPRHYLPKSR